jgi:hypothetical protein
MILKPLQMFGLACITILLATALLCDYYGWIVGGVIYHASPTQQSKRSAEKNGNLIFL